MSAILDNLTAILVGAVLVGALLAVQLREQEQAVATTVQNRVSFHADEFLATVQRDAENIRTKRQTEHAFGDYRFQINRATGTDGETYTSRLSFPTLADPSLGSDSPIGIVSYAMEPTGEMVRVGASQRPAYRITRSLYTRGDGTVATGGAEGVLDFDVFLVDSVGVDHVGTLDQPRDPTVITSPPSQVRIAVMMAAPVQARRAGDQAATTMQNASRRTGTVRVISAQATDGLSPVERGAPGIPAQPLDPPPLPPPPPKAPPPPPTPAPTPSPTPTPTPTPTPAPTPTPGPSTPQAPTPTPAPAPPPPPPPPPSGPPAPPPGRNI